LHNLALSVGDAPLLRIRCAVDSYPNTDPVNLVDFS